MAKTTPLEKGTLQLMENGETDRKTLAEKVGVKPEKMSDILRSLRVKGFVSHNLDDGFSLK